MTLTQGSETSQYLEEKKTKVILQVAASENREAQTDSSNTVRGSKIET
jgi:hypothetical protein